MKRSLISSVLATVALIGLSSGAKAETVTTITAGTQTVNGYLWQFLVENTSSPPDISHFVIGICDTALSSIITSTIKYAEVGYTGGAVSYNVAASYQLLYSTGSGDPTTGAYGIKFDDNFDNVEYKLVEFYLNQDLGSQTGTVTFKSGNEVTTTTTLTPGCTPVSRIPEPGSMALLGLGTLALGAVIARRRR